MTSYCIICVDDKSEDVSTRVFSADSQSGAMLLDLLEKCNRAPHAPKFEHGSEPASEVTSSERSELARILLADEKFYLEAEEELNRARKKFPTNELMMIALIEEVGELARALIEFRMEEASWERVEEEAVQVAVMAQRVYAEGGSSIK